MRRTILSAAGVIAALVLQLTVVNRLPWPGAGTPDLVLIMVVALGLCGGPATGALTGFLAGLCLDIAPPASYLIGEYALVFCVVGYGCGRLRGLRGDSAWRSIALAIAAVAAGEALVCAVGLLVGDPQVTWPAIRQALPASVGYDAALSPFVLYLVVRALDWAAVTGPGNQLAGAALAKSVSPEQARAAAALPGGAGLLGGSGWLAGPKGSRDGAPGRAPRLREAAARSRDGWIGGSHRSWRTAGPQPGGRRLRLRPGSGQAGSAAAIPQRRELQQRPVNLRLGSARRRPGRGNGSPGSAFGRPGGPAPGLPRGHGPRGKAFRGSSGPAGPAFGGTGHGPPGKAFRGAGQGPPGKAFRGAGHGPPGKAFRGAGHGPPGKAFRGGSGSAGSAFGGGSGPAGRAFRYRGSGAGGSAFRGAGHGPPGKAFRRRGSSGPAFSGGRPRSGGSLLAGSGGPARAARFRPDARMPGGSALGSPRRVLATRPVTLRLRAPRRRDGVIGGLARGTRRQVHGVRPVRLRLGGPRRGDGMVAGLAPADRRLRQRSRRAAPRFRTRSGGWSVLPGRRSALPGRRSALSGRRSVLAGRRPVLAGRRSGLGSGRQARFRSSRRSVLAGWTRRRLGTSPGRWRAGGGRVRSRS